MYGGSQAVGEAQRVVIISCGAPPPPAKNDLTLTPPPPTNNNQTLVFFGVCYFYIFRCMYIFTISDLKN